MAYKTKAKTKRKCILCGHDIAKGEDCWVSPGRGSVHNRCYDAMDAIAEKIASQLAGR